MPRIDDPLAFSWALICSVPDKNCIPTLRDFALWLTSALEDRAIHYGCTHRFNKEPKAVFHTTPGNEKEIHTVYDIIHEDHPEVIVVFHILPMPNSLEYKLMKKLADEYDLIRQGILLENAMTQFKNCDKKELFGNILQWFSRRMAQLVAIEKSSAKFILRVGNEKKPSLCKTSFTATSVMAAVHKVLHSKNNEPVSCSSTKAVVQVSGYPHFYNEFEIAGNFNKFRVIGVTKMNETALVEFANEFHAAQAAIEYDHKRIDSIHVLAVLPTHPVVIREVEIALSGIVPSQPTS